MARLPFTEYRTITRLTAFSRGFDLEYLYNEHDFKVARTILDNNPRVEIVYFARRLHNTIRTRYNPPPGTAVYVKAAKNRAAVLRIGGANAGRCKDVVQVPPGARMEALPETGG